MTTVSTPAGVAAAISDAIETKADLVNGDVPDAQLPDRLAQASLNAATAAAILAQAQTNVTPLAPWFRKLRQDASSAKIALMGDSTMDVAAAGLNYHNAIKAQMKPGLGLDGMNTANVLNHGYNGQTTAQVISDAHVATLAAATPDLINLGVGHNDVRTRTLTTHAADVAWLRALLVTGVDKIRAALPGVPIVMSVPNSFITTDVGSLGYVTNGNPQECSAILRDAYLSLVDQWPDVVVVDHQEAVFGTTSLATSPYMGDQIHPNVTGMYAKVVHLITLIGSYPVRATGRTAAAIAAAQYTPWTSYARDVEDIDRYTLAVEVDYQNQGSTFLDIALPSGQRNNITRGMVIALPGGQGSWMIPMTGGGFSVAANGSYTRILFNAGVIPTNTVTGGKVRIYRQRYGQDSALEDVIRDGTWEFKKLFRVVTGNTTSLTLAPVSNTAEPNNQPSSELVGIIAAGDKVYVEGNAGSPITLTGGQATLSGANVVVSGLSGTDYSTYTNRLVAIVGAHPGASPGATGPQGVAGGVAAYGTSGRWNIPSVMGPASNAAGVAGTDYAVPIAFLNNCSIDRLLAEVKAAVAGSAFRLGLRSSTNGLPDALLADAGTFDASTTGAKESATLGSPVAVTAGPIYWLTMWMTGSANANVGYINGVCHLVSVRNVTNELFGAYSCTRGTTDGALPAAWGSTYTPVALAPLIRARIV